jgi:glutamate dehydrogenase/leucine dehydrogenase
VHFPKRISRSVSHCSRCRMCHEGVFFEVSGQGVALMGAFIWRTNRGQGCGGIRSREYPSARDWLRDGLRLATGMGRKNALAGLFWGGAKGVVAQPPPSELPLTAEVRQAIFTDYGRFLTSLRGCYVAAEDSGVFAIIAVAQSSPPTLSL